MICTDKKYVFVKVNKTGGTSIYRELRKHSKFQYLLGSMYNQRLGVPQNYKTAMKWYTLAAEQGDASAQSNLGWMYNQGKGVPQDDKTALKWWRLSAEQGDAGAQNSLGGMYRKGTGVLQDHKTAAKWYKLAAEQGYAGVKRRHDHVKSSWIKENTFPELGLDWDKYFKFGFVRNPWDRELSNYFYNSGKLKPPEDISFKEWLNIRYLQKRPCGPFLWQSHNSPQCDYLTDVDYIARFENYDEEVKYIFNRIGVPMPQPLMHINKTDHKPYYEYYDGIDIMKVQQWYEKDIEMYNYEFGE